MSKKVNKNNVNAKNNVEIEKENTSTPFYYYIIRYGLFLIPCTILLVFGIFLVNLGWNRVKADKQPQAQPTSVETTEQISDSIDSESVDEPETVSELQESGNLKLSADFAFKLRDLKTKLELDTNLLNDDLSSKLEKNVYFAGEVINVDGLCGGFNLMFAFACSYVIKEALINNKK